MTAENRVLILLSLGIFLMQPVVSADGHQGLSDSQLFEHAVSLRDTAM